MARGPRPATSPCENSGPLCPPPNETGCKVAGLNNSCIHSVALHSWCQIMWQYPATALDRLADMISGRAVEDTPTTNLFAWVRWIVTKEQNLSQDCHADWKIGSLPEYYNVLLRPSPHMAAIVTAQRPSSSDYIPFLVDL